MWSDSGYFKIDYIVMALASVLGLSALLESLAIEYFVMYGNVWAESVFSLGSNLNMVLLVLILCQGFFIGRRGFWVYLLAPVLTTFFLRGWGWSAGLAVGGLILSIVYLVFEKRIRVFFFWVFALLSLFELITALHWLIFYPIGVTSFSVLAVVENELFYLLVHFSPYLYLLVILYSLATFLRGGYFFPSECHEVVVKSSRFNKIFLVLLCFAAVFLAFYPYLGSVNPSDTSLGYDIPDYIENLDAIDGAPQEVFSVKEGSRPVIYLLLWVIKTILGLDSAQTVRVVFTVLNLLMVLSAYYLVNSLFLDQNLAVISSFFALFGFPVVVGMSAGFLANLLALCLENFSLGALFTSLRRENSGHLGLAMILGGLVLFTHPWTFDHYTGIMILFGLLAVINHREKTLKDTKSRLILVYIVVMVSAELLRSILFSGIGGTSALGELAGGLTNLSGFWESVNISTWFIYGGLYGNSVLIIFALYALINLNKAKMEEYYLSLFMFSTSIIWVIGNAVIKDRLLYNSPIWLLSSFGLLKILRDSKYGYTEKMFTIFLVIMQVTYAFRGLANHI
jgi:hypothetical protein